MKKIQANFVPRTPTQGRESGRNRRSGLQRRPSCDLGNRPQNIYVPNRFPSRYASAFVNVTHLPIPAKRPSFSNKVNYRQDFPSTFCLLLFFFFFFTTSVFVFCLCQLISRLSNSFLSEFPISPNLWNKRTSKRKQIIKKRKERKNGKHRKGIRFHS